MKTTITTVRKAIQEEIKKLNANMNVKPARLKKSHILFERAINTRNKVIHNEDLENKWYLVYTSDTNSFNVFKIEGFTGNENKYGEGPIKYKTVKQMLIANKVNSLKELEKLDSKNEYGYFHYMKVFYLTSDTNINNISSNIFDLYLFDGNWSVGSSANPVTFYKITF